MVWQKGITHIFTWTNIIIPKHKHVNISVFSLGRNTAPDLNYEKMTHFVCVKLTCQGCYWSLPQRSPQVFLSLFVWSQGGREERERKNREWNDDPKNGAFAGGSSAPRDGSPNPELSSPGMPGLVNNSAIQSRDEEWKGIVSSFQLHMRSSSRDYFWLSLCFVFSFFFKWTQRVHHRKLTLITYLCLPFLNLVLLPLSATFLFLYASLPWDFLNKLSLLRFHF